MAEDRTATAGSSDPRRPCHWRQSAASSAGIVPAAKSDWICSLARSSDPGSLALAVAAAARIGSAR